MAKLTAPRRAALEVLAKWHPQPCASAKKTDDTGLVHWTAGDALVAGGYAERDAHASQYWLTPAGLDLCRSEGIALSDDGSPDVATDDAPTTSDAPAATFAYLPLDRLVPSPGNLRRDLGDLEGLAESIKADGVQQALLVTLDFPAGDRWMVLAGHRRLAAARLAGLTEVPCMIREAVPEDRRVAVFLVENLRREGLAALEEAEGYRQLVALGWSQRKIAESVGCGQPHVSKRLALLDLPEEIKARVDLPMRDPKRVSLEEAAELLKLKGAPKAMKAAARPNYGTIAGAVERELERIAFHEGIGKLKAAAAAKGWPTRTTPEGYGAKTDYSRFGPYDLDVDPKAHESEACHAVLIPRESRAVPKALDPICVDPSRHKPRGQSNLKVKTKPKREDPWAVKDRLDKAGRKEAQAARLDSLRAVVAKPNTRDATRLALLDLVTTEQYDVASVACELLEIPAAKGDYGPSYQKALVEFAVTDLVRVAFAIAVARKERYARQGTGGVAPDLYDLIPDYTPTAWEAARLAERAEAQRRADEREAEDALAAATRDPAEHPPEGALAWYHGGGDDDPPRWLTDEGEVFAIADVAPGRLVMLSSPLIPAGIRSCRVCGCTDDHACAGGCSWAEPDLCSACVAVDAPLAAAAG